MNQKSHYQLLWVCSYVAVSFRSVVTHPTNFSIHFLFFDRLIWLNQVDLIWFGLFISLLWHNYTAKIQKSMVHGTGYYVVIIFGSNDIYIFVWNWIFNVINLWLCATLNLISVYICLEQFLLTLPPTKALSTRDITEDNWLHSFISLLDFT